MEKNNQLKILVVDNKTAVDKPDKSASNLADELSANKIDRDFANFLKSIFETIDQHDQSRGKPKRALLTEQLKNAIVRAEENKCMFGVLFLDLDRSKIIDDKLSQQVRGHILRVVEDRLQAIVRDDDTFVRLGGDEFVMIANDVHHEKDLITISKKLITCLNESVNHFGQKLKLTIHIDISIYPRDALKINMLLQSANAE